MSAKDVDADCVNQAPVRHLAASPTGSIVAAGEFERRVHIWDLVSKKCVRSLETILDFGGSRLAISSDGRHLVAGSYRSRGVSCYSVEGGNEVWQRPDLKKPQILHFSRDGSSVIVGTDDRKCRFVDRETGRLLREIGGVSNVIESAYEPVMFVSADVIEIRTSGYELIATIPRITPVELDATFAANRILISESEGPIRCCDTTTGREIWRHYESGRHALYLQYIPSIARILAIDWAYEHGGSYRLMNFDACTGRKDIVAQFEPGEVVFCLGGTCLLTANGSIFDTHNGRKLGQLWA